MRVVFGLDAVGANLAGGVLSIGNFDGVHLGHQRILKTAVRRANTVAGPLVAVTFEPHPLAVLMPDTAPAVLTPMNEKLIRLAEYGADAVVVVQTDPNLLSIEADAFVQDVILRLFRAAAVVEGPSFNYGKHRQGNVDTLRAAGARYGFDVEIVESVQLQTAPGRYDVISSSMIRRALSAGDVALAARALGRPYGVIGPVVEGHGRGRELGFPTANVAAPGQLLPAEGVYAGQATVSSETFPAAISVGRTPTFQGTATLIEAHLLDFDRAVYGKEMRIEFTTWLRGQEYFDSAEALQAQIAQDVETVRHRAPTA